MNCLKIEEVAKLFGEKVRPISENFDIKELLKESIQGADYKITKSTVLTDDTYSSADHLSEKAFGRAPFAVHSLVCNVKEVTTNRENLPLLINSRVKIEDTEAGTNQDKYEMTLHFDTVLYDNYYTLIGRSLCATNTIVVGEDAKDEATIAFIRTRMNKANTGKKLKSSNVKLVPESSSAESQSLKTKINSSIDNMTDTSTINTAVDTSPSRNNTSNISANDSNITNTNNNIKKLITSGMRRSLPAGTAAYINSIVIPDISCTDEQHNRGQLADWVLYLLTLTSPLMLEYICIKKFADIYTQKDDEPTETLNEIPFLSELTDTYKYKISIKDLEKTSTQNKGESQKCKILFFKLPDIIVNSISKNTESVQRVYLPYRLKDSNVLVDLAGKLKEESNLHFYKPTLDIGTVFQSELNKNLISRGYLRNTNYSIFRDYWNMNEEAIKRYSNVLNTKVFMKRLMRCMIESGIFVFDLSNKAEIPSYVSTVYVCNRVPRTEERQGGLLSGLIILKDIHSLYQPLSVSEIVDVREISGTKDSISSDKTPDSKEENSKELLGVPADKFIDWATKIYDYKDYIKQSVIYLSRFKTDNGYLSVRSKYSKYRSGIIANPGNKSDEQQQILQFLIDRGLVQPVDMIPETVNKVEKQINKE